MTAQHKQVMIPGRAGNLEGLLWAPEPSQNIDLAAVVCHPHPLYQGTMHNKVVYQAAKALDSMGIPVLRFNFRGVGASDGTYDHGHGEEDDVRTALDFLSSQFSGAALIAAGFSFGAWVGLRAGCSDHRVVDLIGLGLPIDDRKLGFGYLRTCTKSKLLVQGEIDQYGGRPHFENFIQSFRLEAARETRVIFIPGADHFFKDHLDEVADALRHWMSTRHPNLRLSGSEN